MQSNVPVKIERRTMCVSVGVCVGVYVHVYINVSLSAHFDHLWIWEKSAVNSHFCNTLMILSNIDYQAVL